ncbi:MAG: hypothetical protein LIP23_05925, partial [Planctomycetes bacterium]|nr:hypothetical protein [Planctomycetota bacterium]
KQDQYSPLTVAEQVAVIIAGSKGFFDDVETATVVNVEKNLLEYLNANRREVLDHIQSTGDLDAETERALTRALEDFKQAFIEPGAGSSRSQSTSGRSPATELATRASARAGSVTARVEPPRR